MWRYCIAFGRCPFRAWPLVLLAGGPSSGRTCAGGLGFQRSAHALGNFYDREASSQAINISNKNFQTALLAAPVQRSRPMRRVRVEGDATVAGDGVRGAAIKLQEEIMGPPKVECRFCPGSASGRLSVLRKHAGGSEVVMLVPWFANCRFSFRGQWVVMVRYMAIECAVPFGKGCAAPPAIQASRYGPFRFVIPRCCVSHAGGSEGAVWYLEWAKGAAEVVMVK
ncbi:hypothetical protein C8J57DRAFT_1230589 [Mycena rebaudengoi]|nr:hypothetical protein C8J57DRAFT_1230589 [Mycena rebaudengoi]